MARGLISGRNLRSSLATLVRSLLRSSFHVPSMRTMSRFIAKPHNATLTSRGKARSLDPTCCVGTQCELPHSCGVISRPRGATLESDQREMAERRHGAALHEAHAGM